MPKTPRDRESYKDNPTIDQIRVMMSKFNEKLKSTPFPSHAMHRTHKGFLILLTTQNFVEQMDWQYVWHLCKENGGLMMGMRAVESDFVFEIEL